MSAPTWKDVLDASSAEYARSVMREFEHARNVTYVLRENIRREERRRDPYDRLTTWMRNYPSWRDQVAPSCYCR